jgi:hypothetical protein
VFSASGDIAVKSSELRASDLLDISAGRSQWHEDVVYEGGALSVRTETAGLAMRNAQLKANATPDIELQALSGQLVVESGAGMYVDPLTRFQAAGDLTLITGRGGIQIDPDWKPLPTPPIEFEQPQMVRLPAPVRPLSDYLPGLNGQWDEVPHLQLSQTQLISGRGLTLAARDGWLALNGTPGFVGYESSQRVSFDLPGDIRLIGNSVNLQGSKLRTPGRVDVTATQGDLGIHANRATASEHGFTNTYWDRAEIAAGQGFDLRALGDINATGLWTHSWGHANVLAGGHLSVSGVYNDWQYQQGASLWQQHYLTEIQLTAEQGITLGAMGGQRSVRLRAGHGGGARARGRRNCCCFARGQSRA